MTDKQGTGIDGQCNALCGAGMIRKQMPLSPALSRQGRGLVNSRPAGVTRSKTLPQNKTKTFENKATKEEKLIKILIPSHNPVLLLPWVTVSIIYIVVQTKHAQLSGAVLPDTQEDVTDVFFSIRYESYFCCVMKS